MSSTLKNSRVDKGRTAAVEIARQPDPVGDVQQTADDKVNILVVDDRPENLITLSVILEQPDRNIVQVRSGKEALRCLLNQSFAAILLDVNMPEINGFETAALIRQRKNSAHTPIIFVTAFSDEENLFKGYSLGAVDYILTPVQPDVLRSKVAVFVDLFRKTVEVQRQAELLRQAEEKLRRRAERALAESEQRFQVTFNQAAVGMALIGIDGEWTAANQKICDIFGFKSKSDMQAHRLADIVEPQPGPEGRTIDPFSTDADSHSVEAIYHRKDRSKVWVHLVTSIVRGPDGKPKYTIVVIQDISTRKKAQQELKALNEVLEQRVAERTEALRVSHEQLRRSERLASLGTLAAGIAHEINNPVNAILLAAEYALECNLDPAGQKESLRLIIQETQRCGSIVKNVLRFAKEEKTIKTPRNINDVLYRAVSLARSYIQSPNLVLQSRAADDLPELLLSSTQIEQVLINLVQNAVQAADGTVQVTITSAQANGEVHLIVEDNGPGIPEDRLPYIFDPFYSTRQNRGGTGLGLSIAHGIVTDHGGSIDVHSKVGEGTTFVLRFPIPEPAVL